MTKQKYSLCLGIVSLYLLALPSYAVSSRHHHHQALQQDPVSDAPRHHHRHDALLSRVSERDRVREERQPRRDQADSGYHLTRLHEMSRADRIALRHHNRRLYEQEEVQAQQEAEARRRDRRLSRRDRVEAEVPSAADELHSHHRARHHSSDSADLVPIGHLTRHEARLLSEHNARLAALQATRHEEDARAEARHYARLRYRQAVLAQRILEHNTRIARRESEIEERAAESRAHWVALHGNGNSSRSIQYWETEAANVPVKVITVDLNDPNVKVSAELSRWGAGTSEPFGRMIERANPNVAVTGTFFSLDNLMPVGDIVIDGNLVHFGGMGTALCITPDNKAKMITVTWGRHHDWTPYDFVCACGPRLLGDGKIVLDPHAERFHDQHMLSPNSRIAVGITPGNKLVFVMTHQPIYLGRLARVMQLLGVSEAMNLDAGTSTGLFYNGTTLAWPGRRLTNMIVVYGKKDQYEHNLDQLLPENFKRADAVTTRTVSLLPHS